MCINVCICLDIWVHSKFGYKAIQKNVVYTLDGTFKWHCYELITGSQKLFFLGSHTRMNISVHVLIVP